MADEFELLDDFGRRPTVAKRLLYLLFALEAVGATTWLFIRIFLIDLSASQVTLSLGILISTILLSLSYHNLSFAKATRIRRNATAPSKGAYKGKPDEYAAAQKTFEEKISSAALWFSFSHNNAIFMILTPLLAKYLFADKIGGDLNLLFSGAAAASIALFNSQKALQGIGE